MTKILKLLVLILLFCGLNVLVLAQFGFSDHVPPDPNWPSISPRITYRNDSSAHSFKNKLQVPLTFYDVCRSLESSINAAAYLSYNGNGQAPKGMYQIYQESGLSPYHSERGWYGLADNAKAISNAPSLQLLRPFREWHQSAELRQSAAGGFVNAGNGIWNEIERLNTLDQQSKARREASEQQAQTDCFAGSWTNIGPFFNNTLNDADAQSFHKNYTPGIGRVAVLRKHPTQDILYMGGATGGLWKSVPNGASEPIGHRWQVVGAGAGDIFPSMGIADIAFNSSGSTMYVATGDRTRGLDALEQTSYSVGVLKSTDSGTTWQRLANDVQWHILDNGELKPINPIYTKIQRLLVLPNGDLTIAANVFTDVLGIGVNAESERNIFGVWKYNATNHHWEQVAGFNNAVSTIEFGNTTQTAIVAVSLKGQVKRSTDGGTNWVEVIGDGYDTMHSSLSNVVHSGTEDVMYLMKIGNDISPNTAFTLSKSTDGGASFVPINLSVSTNPLPNHSDIHSFEPLATAQRSVITINPANVNEVYLGAAGNISGNGRKVLFKVLMNGTTVQSTTAVAFSPKDAGNIVGSQYVHTDLDNFLWIGNKLFIAHDGGLSYTQDGGTTWSKWYETTRDLCITESLSLSNTKSGTYQSVYASSWDNGFFRATRNGSTGNFNWFNSGGGDGFQIVVNPQNSVGYAVSNSYLHRYQPTPAGTNTSSDVFSTNPGNEIGAYGIGQSQFLCDIKLFPVSPAGTPLTTPGIMSGFRNLVRIKQNTGAFEALSTGCCDYATYPPYVPNTENPWSAVDIAGTKVYAGRTRVVSNVSQSLIAYSNDNGLTWTQKSATNLPTSPGKILTDLVINQQNPSMLFATYSGFDSYVKDIQEAQYNAANVPVGGKVFMSVNGGDTWTDITAGKVIPSDPYGNPDPSLPKNMLPDLPILCAALYAPDATTWHLFVGTDVGVYYTNNSLNTCAGGIQWLPFSGGLARVSVQELELFTDGGNTVLRAATWGRGIWETAIPADLGANCTCATCGQAAYPLIAHIAAVPNSVVGHPEAYLAPNWNTAISSNTEIRLVNGSSGTFGSNACTWSFSGGTGTVAPIALTDCSGNSILSSLASYHGSCLIGTWENFTALPQTITVNLSVTDLAGCQTSSSSTLVIMPFDPDCGIGNSVEYLINPSYTICGNNGLCKTLLPTGTGTGSLKITPNIFAGSGEFSYQLYKLDELGAIVATYPDNNVRAIWQANGNIAFECLEPANYSLVVTDQATACIDQVNNLNIGNAGAMSIALTDELTNSYRLCLSEPGQLPDRKTGKINILTVNGVATQEVLNDFAFTWSDCATCTEATRSNLAKGTYTVTVTHRPTACTFSKTYEILFNNITVVSGGFVVDNGGISISDPEPSLRITAPSIFDDQAQVRIDVPQDMYITITVYNTSGVQVKKILDNQLKAKGIYYYMHNATNLPNGLYTYIVKGCEEQDYDTGFKY